MNNNKEREARVKEINRLLGKLSDVPAPKPMTKEEYDAMINRWERGDYCIKEIKIKLDYES